MYAIEFYPEALDVIAKWKKSNAKLYKKYAKLLEELISHPKSGIGHPETLKNGYGIRWSRHVSAHDRIIYDIFDDRITVIVVKVEGHYNDK